MCYMVDWLALPPLYDVAIPLWLEHIGAMLHNQVHTHVGVGEYFNIYIWLCYTSRFISRLLNLFYIAMDLSDCASKLELSYSAITDGSTRIEGCLGEQHLATGRGVEG